MRVLVPAGMALAVLLAGCAAAPQRVIDPAAVAADGACAPVELAGTSRFAVSVLDTGLPTAGQWRDGFDVADIDGDGHLDVVHGPARKGLPQPNVFRGDGTGRFAHWSDAHFPALPYDYGDVQAGDLNGDGRVDIALTAHLRGMVVLLNEGGGHFAPWGEGIGLHATVAAGERVFTSRTIALADWNGDGLSDIVALNEGPSRLGGTGADTDAFVVLLNRKGYWQRVVTGAPLQGFGDSLSVGDFNGDGSPDALIGTQVNGTRMLLHRGNPAGFRAFELHALPPRADVPAVLLHDFDRDGRADALFGTRSIEGDAFCTGLYVAQFDADGGERSQPLWREASRDPVVALAVADFDRDGYDDLLAARQRGTLLLFAGGAEGFRQPQAIASPSTLDGCDVFDVEAEDVDADGRIEVLVGYAGEHPGAGAVVCPSRGGFHAWRIDRG